MLTENKQLTLHLQTIRDTLLNASLLACQACDLLKQGKEARAMTALEPLERSLKEAQSACHSVKELISADKSNARQSTSKIRRLS